MSSTPPFALYAPPRAFDHTAEQRGVQARYGALNANGLHVPTCRTCKRGAVGVQK